MSSEIQIFRLLRGYVRRSEGYWKGMVKKVNPSHFYAYEKFSDALHSLATGPADVRQRLRSAYLHFRVVQKEQLPVQLQSDYQWVLDQLTRFEPAISRNGEVVRGPVEETLSRIRNSTGTKIAERILSIYHQLNWLYMEGSESPNKADSADATSRVDD